MNVFVVFLAWPYDARPLHYFATPELCTYLLFVIETSSCVPFDAKRPSFRLTTDRSLSKIFAPYCRRYMCEKPLTRKKASLKILSSAFTEPRELFPAKRWCGSAYAIRYVWMCTGVCVCFSASLIYLKIYD